MKHRHAHIQHKIKHLKPRKLIIQRPGFWMIILLLLMVSSAVYFLFFFQKFQVTTITVSGNQNVNGNTIETRAWQDIQKKFLGIFTKNIFTINADALKQSLLAAFPEIEDINVQKQWFEGLNLKVTERAPVAIFCPDFIADPRSPGDRDSNESTDNCFYIDKNGVIYQKLQIIPSDSVIVRKDINEQELILGKSLVDKNIMDDIIKIKDSLKNNSQVDVGEVLVSNPLVVTTSENWKVYFDPQQDINLQITKLTALLKDQISSTDRKTLQYIYLQYGDRAYYK